MTLQELHSNGKIQWPGDARIAVLLSFDFQGGEDVRPDKNGKMNHEEYTQAEYGPQTGIYRILRILAAHEVKATFLDLRWDRRTLSGSGRGDHRRRAMKWRAMAIITRWRVISPKTKSATS